MASRPQGDSDEPAGDGGGQRLDKWLWYARVAKTRTLAASLVSGAKVRVNRQKVTKPAHVVRVGDVVTVTVARGVRVLRIQASGVRRGPASEAQTLYDEIVPLPGGRKTAVADAVDVKPAGNPQGTAGLKGDAAVPVAVGSGRPTKRDRRALARLRPRFDEG